MSRESDNVSFASDTGAGASANNDSRLESLLLADILASTDDTGSEELVFVDADLEDIPAESLEDILAQPDYPDLSQLLHMVRFCWADIMRHT